MLKKLDVGFALVTLVLGVYSVIEGISYGFRTAEGHPGSGFFPIVVGIALIGFSLINILRSGVEVTQIKEVWSNQVAIRALFILIGHSIIIALFTFLGLLLSADDFNMTTKDKTLLKEQLVLGGQFDKNNYVEERVWATAADGTKIPMSMVYRKGMKKDGKNPVLQYAYGSYGYTIDPYFSTSRLSLLDRGFVYVLCHIRGGQYMGREWYENGKMLKKMNTFTDFIACSKFLIQQKYTSAEHLYAQGGSAGGLLMGVITNLAPELYNGIVSQVPFLDVVTTMLDESIPLTTGEFDEWGNPKNKEYYDYMLSYSPYDNLEAKDYPNILITSGFHDSQVQYWEPTKYVAKLRTLKTDKKWLFLDTNMDAGHGGASGRYESLKEVAKVYAFLLDLESKI